MFEKFDSGLKNVSKCIKNTFELFDSIQNKATGAVDIYSKVNNKLRTDIDRLYLVIQQCYDECTSYLTENDIDVDDIEAVPYKYRNAIKSNIYPIWRSFQHSVNKTLDKYKTYLPKLDNDIVEELQIAIKMDIYELLNIFDNMLKSVKNGGAEDEDAGEGEDADE